MFRGFKATKPNPKEFFDAIIAVHDGKIKVCQASSKFNVTSHVLKTTIYALRKHEKKLGKILEEISSKI